jgi:hypothetical protein
MCKYVLPPGVNPIAVDKHININININTAAITLTGSALTRTFEPDMQF